jgi:hypothetical protein
VAHSDGPRPPSLKLTLEEPLVPVDGDGQDTGDVEGALASAPEQPAEDGAASSAGLPPVCLANPRFDVAREMRCYAAVAAAAGAGRACAAGSAPSGAAGQELHTLSTGEALPVEAALMLWSFLATQCCDVSLTVWMRPGSLRSLETPEWKAAFSPPAAAGAHRVRFRELDLPSELASVAADVQEVLNNKTVVDRVLSTPWPMQDTGSVHAIGSDVWLANFLKVFLLYRRVFSAGRAAEARQGHCGPASGSCTYASVFSAPALSSALFAGTAGRLWTSTRCCCGTGRRCSSPR